jgi:hypothetical protein
VVEDRVEVVVKAVGDPEGLLVLERVEVD